MNTVFYSCLALMMIILVVYTIKNGNTSKQMKRITTAIYLWGCKQQQNGALWQEVYIDGDIMFDHMKSYTIVLLRFWDWGYKHILPPEDYERIKPFV